MERAASLLFESEDVDGLREPIIAGLSDRESVDRMRTNAQDTAAWYTAASVARSARVAYLK